MVGASLRINTASGNIEISVYSEELEKLGGTGVITCPSTSDGRVIQFTAAIDVTVGKNYWILCSASDTTIRLGCSEIGLHGFRSVTATLTNAQPAPARINPLPDVMGMGTRLVFSVGLFLEPPLVKKAATDTTIAAMDDIYEYDPANGRIFGRAANAFVWSEDLGDTVQTGATFAGETIGAQRVAGNYLFVATTVNADNTGKIRRVARTGPYAAENFTLVLDAQEGSCLPWNLKAYSDGTVFAGNYTAAGAAQVRVRRSTDWGDTWATVLDLGASDGNLEHVHSVMRDPTDTDVVYCNVGDAGALSGVYVSADGGATFTRNATFGEIRLTEVVPIDAGALWASDAWQKGGNLFVQDRANTYLAPRSLIDVPWHGDVYAMSKDDDGVIWYMVRGAGQVSSRRSAIFASPDDGVTSYLVHDLGSALNDALAVFRIGTKLFLGDGTRLDVSSVVF